MIEKVGKIHLEIEGDIEYVKISSPENQVILKVIFDIQDKPVILHLVIDFIRQYVDDTYPNKTVSFEFSKEWLRVFAGVAETQIIEVESDKLRIAEVLLLLMLGYDIINWIF